MSQRVLCIHYTLTDKEGKQLDSSRETEPFPILEGARQIIPSLEEEIVQMNVGDRKTVELTPEKAYGVVNEQLKISVERSKLPEGDIYVGLQFRTSENPADPIFTVVNIEGDTVHMDGNHPLAGQDLTFDIELVSVREATQDELEHGHAHGPDGHGHHH